MLTFFCIYPGLGSNSGREDIVNAAKKAALAASIFNPEAQFGGGLKIEEINSLFEPLGKAAI